MTHAERLRLYLRDRREITDRQARRLRKGSRTAAVRRRENYATGLDAARRRRGTVAVGSGVSSTVFERAENALMHRVMRSRYRRR
jgi:hypothetical protein